MNLDGQIENCWKFAWKKAKLNDGRWKGMEWPSTEDIEKFLFSFTFGFEFVFFFYISVKK